MSGARQPAVYAPMEQLLRVPSVFPGFLENAAALRGMVAQLQHGATASSRPFRILLAGGTGVGKSTLLNAVAGAPIAVTGERRPTTTGFTAYLYAHDDDPWLHALPGVRVIRHGQESLEGKVLLDSPDADSAVVDHLRMLEDALALADLVLVVVTDEKYVSSRVLQLLAIHREGRDFAFIFNKADLLTDTAVVDDLAGVVAAAGFSTARVFALSARAAFRNRMEAAEEPEGDFGGLLEFIVGGLSRAQRAAIAHSNLAERAGVAARMVRASLPPTWESAPTDWRERCMVLIASACADIAGTIRRYVLPSGSLAATITAQRGAGFSGLFGVFAALAYGLRRLIPGSPVLSRAAVDSWVRARAAEALGDRVSGADDVLRESFVMRAAELELDSGTIRSLVSEVPARHTSNELVQERLPSLLIQELDRAGSPPGLAWRVAANLPAWAWVVYWIARTVSLVLAGRSPEWEAFPGAAVVLLVILAIEWPLAHGLLVRSGRTRARILASRVLSGLEASLSALHTPAVDAAAARMEHDVDLVRTTLTALESLGSTDTQHRPTPGNAT